MRPQQNRRIPPRRNNNNGAMRRAPNPLTRNYESSGPEVKIRGNAQHIADKYIALARDAQALGDRILAESYHQHAEHYVRIILAAQDEGNNARPPRSDAASSRIDDGEDSAPAYIRRSSADDNDEPAPQPVIDGVPGEVALMGRNGGYKDNSAEDDDRGQPRRRLPARRNSMPRRPFRSDVGADDEQPGFNNAAPAGSADGESVHFRRPRIRAEGDNEGQRPSFRRSRFTPADDNEGAEQPSPRTMRFGGRDAERDNSALPQRAAAEEKAESVSQVSVDEAVSSARRDMSSQRIPSDDENAAMPRASQPEKSASADSGEDVVAGVAPHSAMQTQASDEEAKPARRTRRSAAADSANGGETPVKRPRGRPRRVKIASVTPAEPEQSEQADNL